MIEVIYVVVSIVILYTIFLLFVFLQLALLLPTISWLVMKTSQFIDKKN